MVSVNDLLIVHRRVDGGDRPGLNAKGIIKQLDDGNNAVGGAGGVRDDAIVRTQIVLIDAEDHGGVKIAAARMGKEHLLCPGGQVRFAVLTVAVDAGAVQHDVDFKLAPGQRVKGWLVQETDRVMADK